MYVLVEPGCEARCELRVGDSSLLRDHRCTITNRAVFLFQDGPAPDVLSVSLVASTCFSALVTTEQEAVPEGGSSNRHPSAAPNPVGMIPVAESRCWNFWKSPTCLPVVSDSHRLPSPSPCPCHWKRFQPHSMKCSLMLLLWHS